MNRKIVALLLIALLFGGGAAYYFYFGYDHDWEPAVDDTYPSSKNIDGNKQASPAKDVEYELRNTNKQINEEGYGDASLIEKNKKTGEEVILVPSVKDAIPDLQNAFNLILEKLSFPENSNFLYFTSILGETDAPPQGIYAYDLRQKTFTRLAVSNYFAAFGPTAISPDGKRIATTIEPGYSGDGPLRKLYLLDLERDAVKLLIEVAGDETLNQCAYCSFGGNQGYLRWLDGETVEYAVYDMTKTIPANPGYPDWEEKYHPLIEKRRVPIE